MMRAKKNQYFILLIIIIFILNACTYKQTKTDAYSSNTKQKEASFSELVSNSLNREFHNKNYINSLSNTDIPKYISKTVFNYYQDNSFKPYWINDSKTNKSASSYLLFLKNIEMIGLDPNDYLYDEIKSRLSEKRKGPDSYAGFDVILTTSFVELCSDLLNGKKYKYLSNNQKNSVLNTLKETTRKKNFDEILINFSPNLPVYNNLIIALSKYEGIKSSGGWPKITYGGKLKKGQKDPRIKILKKRLSIPGYLDNAYLNNIDFFDNNVERAVRNFQKRHGLYEDGVVGENTLFELNVPVEKRIQQIKLNIQRLRQLPKELGNRYILVNVSNYHLYGIENNNVVLSMKVIVGKPKWNTPIFEETMSYVVLNPKWNIPQSIFKDDILSRIKSDPEYLAKENIIIIDGWESNSTTIDSELIEWDKIDPDKFSYRLQQTQGPANPLGRIKFMFPNNHNVYLHDTPNKDYFYLSRRNLSHGCIRVEKPLDLAEFVFNNKSFTQEKIIELINLGETKYVDLPKPIPVVIQYFTAWADTDGTVSFSRDVYNLDYQAIYQQMSSL